MLKNKAKWRDYLARIQLDTIVILCIVNITDDLDNEWDEDEDRESGKDKSKQQKAEKVNVRTQKGVSTSVGASTIIREVPSNYATKRKAINGMYYKSFWCSSFSI